ncbi:carbohydrate ABC transporter permease [Halobacterium litoreum]|uniref:Carbohydrate ABC transporter permease n=1 Tax=Halobacterium litoreum TaxID=2039234 RepID=A0ABD5NBG6_9EURY|nr:carbohydrate ABC transporter permease [Halobacterium litoreum]UHH14596.1 carbohydrate ABC transporter permease [Halobacterium litoreum]
MSTSDRIDLQRVGLYGVLGALVVFYLAPIETGLVTSLKSNPLDTAPFLPPGPGGFTLSEWTAAFSALQSGLVNSLILAIPATILSALLGSMAAYGLTTLNWRGQVGVFALFIAGIFIPYQAVLLPVSRFWAKYVPLSELLAPLWLLPVLEPYHGELIALIVTHVAYGIPICTLLFRTYYRDFSTEMVEAAKLDGATAYTLYRRVILPLSVPMFAVTLIYQFTQVWNDLLFALVIMGPGQGAPVTVGLTNIGSSMTSVGFAVKMAGAFIAALPTMIVYVIFGEQFAEGVAT